MQKIALKAGATCYSGLLL